MFSGLDDSDQDIVYEGPASTVVRIQATDVDHARFTKYIAIKSFTTNKKYAQEPHDIIKEARLIASASHPSVISLIKQEWDSRSQTMRLWMPYIPFSLYDLLASPTFSPRPLVSFESAVSGPPVMTTPTPREHNFTLLSKSLLFQTLHAIAYLHQTVHIAHRDIKPSNVRLMSSGCVKVIDFGVALGEVGVGEGYGYNEGEGRGDIWPESVDRMYFEVSTGPYRAPELLFGPRTYDAFAIDAWSLGTTFAEFFTPLRLRSDQASDLDSDAGSGSDVDSADQDKATDKSQTQTPSPSNPPKRPLEPFIIPNSIRPSDPSTRWTRDSLFDGDRGEIGLAWSIFKLRGSPDERNWPSFLTLPDATKLSFINVPPTDLSLVLPNLPPSTISPSTGNDNLDTDTKTHTPLPFSMRTTTHPTPLDLIHRFLVFEPCRRLGPADAMRHPWFVGDGKGTVLLPEDYPVPIPLKESPTFTFKCQDKTLGDLLRAALPGHVYTAGLG